MRRLALLTGCAALLLAGSQAASAGDRAQQRAPSHAQASPSQRTYPRVIPPRGHSGTSFAAYFTLRSRPGHQGVFAITYGVVVAGGARLPTRCSPPSPEVVRSGAPGSIARVPLPGPRAGWCPGRYRVTVVLDRGPYCPKPAPGEPPKACPLFPDQLTETGAAHFSVR